MAIKFFLVTLFFAVVVIEPVHNRFPEKEIKNPNEDIYMEPLQELKRSTPWSTLQLPDSYSTDYLWY